MQGTVTSTTDFGVFVEVEPGIEGLLHVSEISWTEHGPGLAKKFKPGQVLELKVVSLDQEKKKLSLTLKRAMANPWEEVKRKYPSGTRVKGMVTHLTPFGAFVRLPEGMEGLIHVSDMSWTAKVRHPNEVVTVGQEVEAVVLEVNTQAEKVSLSLKHLSEDPFAKYCMGAVATGTVKKFIDSGAFVELEPGISGFIRISEIGGPKKYEHPSEGLQIGQQVEAKVIKSDLNDRKIDLSIKKLSHQRERELIKKYASKGVERLTLGDILEEE